LPVSLVAIGALMAAVALAVLFIVTAATKTEVANRAAVLAARGDRAAARRLAEPLVASSNAAALLVLACIELEEGHFEAASRLAGRLASLKPDAPEVVVLIKLIEERTRTPTDRWTDVAARAWRTAGRPQPTGNPILKPIDVQRPIDQATIARLTDTGDQFLLAFGEARTGSAGLVDAALAQADTGEHPTGVHLVALSVLLDGKLSDDKRSRARSAAIQLLHRIVRTHPENGYLAAGIPLFGSDIRAPLTQPELAILEDATKRPRFELPMRPLFASFRAAYEQVDPGQAHARAFSETAGAIPLEIHVTLSKRAEATSEPALRSRVAAVLTAAGSRMEAGATFLERMIGAVPPEERSRGSRGHRSHESRR